MDRPDQISRELYEHFKQILLECGRDDWDGEGARHVEKSAIDDLLYTLTWLTQLITIPDVLSAEIDGSVCSTWICGERTIMLCCYGDEMVRYAAQMGHGAFHSGVVPIGESKTWVFIKWLAEMRH